MRGEDYFGNFGGKYVAETLRGALDSLEAAFETALSDASFAAELGALQKTYIGRPTPLIFAENLTKKIGGARIFIKLEGLAHTGAHKINNALAQALLAKKMGKKRLIAETGAGQHGVATAAAAAKLGLECEIYMGALDVARQQPNVVAMELYGAKVCAVKSGAQTLKDAINEALRDWAGSFESTHYLIGSALGPAPFPRIVAHFQGVIGEEIRAQMKGENLAAVVACVGGGSNAMGAFGAFLADKSVRLIAAEAGGVGGGVGQNATRIANPNAKVSVIHGYKSLFLVDCDGQVAPTHSISAGLDYPGIGPQLAHLGETGRVEFVAVSDKKALEALKIFAKNEGILFALESAHGGAAALDLAAKMSPNQAIVINMSGRGDKDIFITSPIFRPRDWEGFLENELRRVREGKDFGGDLGVDSERDSGRLDSQSQDSRRQDSQHADSAGCHTQDSRLLGGKK